MAYNHQLANRVREALVDIPDLKIEEKKMFSGLAFMVNGKMCVNVSGDGLMCRFDPTRHEEIAERNGYEPMVMRGQELKGYCYVNPDGFKIQNDFKFWLDICLDFNDRAKVSKKK
jgi:hypothetical protein